MFKRKDIRDYSKGHKRRLIKQAVSKTMTATYKNRQRVNRIKSNRILKNVSNIHDSFGNSSPSIVQSEHIDYEQDISTLQNEQSTFTKLKESTNSFITGNTFLNFEQSDDDPENSEETYSEAEDDICHDIALWAVYDGITHTSLERLLQILRKSNRYPYLPAKAKTLFQNPRNGVIRFIEPGHYWHNGLKTCLDKLSEEICSDESLETLLLSINIDGLPLFKSSTNCLYPILDAIPCSKQIFVIGCFHGHKKPTNFNDFLKDFVDETINLITNSYKCQGKTYNIKIHKLICDAPAKAAVLNIMSHTGYYSCTKCTVKGSSILNRVCFTNTEAILRSDRDFLIQTQMEHHKGISSLTLIPNFGPITNVPLCI